MGMEGGADSAMPGRYAARNVRKNYGAVQVLKSISLDLKPGRTITVMGENGAGKSTLFKILAGQVPPTDGTLNLDGEPVAFASPSAAHARGIYLVPQEPALLPELSVAETMFVGALPIRGGAFNLFGRVDWSAMRARAREALDALELPIDVDRPARTLSIAQQQQVECAKALLRGCRIILFNEPTSPLTAHEVEHLFSIMRRLRADGCTLSFISHRMDEVLEISDEIAVLRDGVLAGVSERPDFDRARLLSEMVGRPLKAVPRRAASNAREEVALEVRGLSDGSRFADVSFSLRRGEVLGLAGLVGAGRTEVAEAVFGIRPVVAGEVRLGGRDVTGRDSHALIREGLVYVPEDRARHGAVLPMTITENVTSGLLDRVRRRAGLLSAADEDRIAAAAVRDFRVRCAGLDQTVRELSGGNQQKVVFAKWMTTGPRVAILDEPTRGVDVGAKEEIYEMIDALAKGGMALLVISSESEELVRLCDRILSIYEGRVVAELSGADITPAAVARSYLTAAATTASSAGGVAA